MTPPEWVAVVMMVVFAVAGIVGAARGGRRITERAVGRTALEFAARTGWWEGARGGTYVRVEAAGPDRWDVSYRRGEVSGEAQDVTTDEAEMLIGEWWTR